MAWPLTSRPRASGEDTPDETIQIPVKIVASSARHLALGGTYALRGEGTGSTGRAPMGSWQKRKKVLEVSLTRWCSKHHRGFSVSLSS
jgi:hypothetical protein